MKRTTWVTFHAYRYTYIQRTRVVILALRQLKQMIASCDLFRHDLCSIFKVTSILFWNPSLEKMYTMLLETSWAFAYHDKLHVEHIWMKYTCKSLNCIYTVLCSILNKKKVEYNEELYPQYFQCLGITWRVHWDYWLQGNHKHSKSFTQTAVCKIMNKKK